MSKTYARHRSDLRDVYRLAIKEGGWIDLPNWTLCSQPDELDGEEFNVVLFDDSGKPTHIVPSIDLEFKQGE